MKSEINTVYGQEAHCVHCGDELSLWHTFYDYGSKGFYVCCRPACPNYGLLALSVELMKE